MTITLFGFIFILICIYGFLHSYKYVAYIYVFSYLFQTSAVLMVGNIGVSPFLISPLLLYFKGNLVGTDTLDYFSKNVLRISVLFFVYVVCQSIICTFLFDGILVYSSGGMETNLESNGEPLHFTLKNIIQWALLLLNLLGIFSLCTHRQRLDESFSKKVVVVSLSFIVFLGFWRYFTINFGGWFPADFFFSNSTYDLENLEQYIGGFARYTSILLEASYCGLFLSVFVTYIFYMQLRYKNLLIFLCVIGLLLTLSTTGLLLFFITVLLLLLYIKKIKVVFFVLLIGVIGYLIIQDTIWFPLIYAALFEKTESVSAISRTLIMDYEYNLFLKSYFMGCGLGSSISANFLLGLLSQLGIIGTLIYLSYVKILCWPLIENRNWSFVLPLVILLLGMTISGGTLSYPIMWMVFAISVCSIESEVETNGIE